MGYCIECGEPAIENELYCRRHLPRPEEVPVHIQHTTLSLSLVWVGAIGAMASCLVIIVLLVTPGSSADSDVASFAFGLELSLYVGSLITSLLVMAAGQALKYLAHLAHRM